MRDAEPMTKQRDRKASRSKSKVAKTVGLPGRPRLAAKAPSDDWLASWQRSCARSAPSLRACGQPSNGTHVRAMSASISLRQEAAFQSWWRESRSLSLQPQDDAKPSASERLEALRSRVRERQGR